MKTIRCLAAALALAILLAQAGCFLRILSARRHACPECGAKHFWSPRP